MIHLLDVNVLIALIDTKHVDHAMAHEWFDRVSSDGWATCPLTQNGVIRIVGHSSYPNSPGAPAIVAETVAAALDWPGHHFWPDDVSLLTDAGIDPAGSLGRSRSPTPISWRSRSSTEVVWRPSIAASRRTPYPAGAKLWSCYDSARSRKRRSARRCRGMR